VIPFSSARKDNDMQDNEKAVRMLFNFIADHEYDDSISTDELFSSNMNCTVMESLEALCRHFKIDVAKMKAFLKTQIPCDYCGEKTGDVQNIDDENICQKCLEQF
jgi:hypothetical protein